MTYKYNIGFSYINKKKKSFNITIYLYIYEINRNYIFFLNVVYILVDSTQFFYLKRQQFIIFILFSIINTTYTYNLL